MKKFGIWFASAIALLALASCDEKEDLNSSTGDEAYFASKASVSCNASEYTATEDGGAILFSAEGGQVRVNVDCGVDWVVENSATDLFTTSATVVTLTVTATQNAKETELSGTLNLYTANAHIHFATITVNQDGYDSPNLSVETTYVRIPAVGNLSTEITVDASKDWEFRCSSNWLSVEKTGTGLLFTADENGDITERSDDVVVMIDDGVSSINWTVTVIQDGLVYISASLSRFTMYDEAGSSTLKVESNFEWDYSYDTANGWFSLNRDGDILTATVTANQSGDRESVIVLYAGDGEENVAELQIPIVQYGPQPDALILEYTIKSANTSVTLPIAGTVDCTVDWGDNTEIETVTTVTPSHTYATTGTFNVRINGTVTALSSMSFSNSTTPNTTITAVIQWGHTGLTDMSYAFICCTSLSSVPGDTAGAFEDVTLFDYAFQATGLKDIPADLFAYAVNATSFIQTFFNCSSMSAVPEGLFDKCVNAKSFYATFNFCTSLKTIPSGLFDFCPEVLSFNGTFYSCKALQSIPDGLFDSCTKATDFSYTFGECSSLTSIPSGLFAKCVNAYTYYATFYECTSIQAIPGDIFDNNSLAEDFTGTFYDCESITTMGSGLFDSCSSAKLIYMTFLGCSSLTNIPEGLFKNCQEVTTFDSAFMYDESVESVPAGLFDNCSKVTTFYGIFYGFEKVTSIPAGLFDNCPNVTDFHFVFYNWKSLTEIPAGLFDNCPLVTTFNAAFYNCWTLTQIPEDLFKNCPDVTDFAWIFYCCYSLTSFPTGLFDGNKKVEDFKNTFYNIPDVTGESPYTLVDGVKVHLYERSSANGFTTPTSYSGCFRSCRQLDDYDNIPSEWK